MMTTAARDAVLNTFSSHFVGWVSAITDFRAGTVTELSYTGYARASVTFGSPGDTSPAGGRQRANSAPATGGQKTDAGNVTAIGWVLYDDATVGADNPKWVGLLDADPPIVGTAATSDTITAYAHGLSNDQRVFVLSAPGAVIPTGLSENMAYFVVSSATDTFQLSATQGGAAVDITAGGAAMFCPYTPLTIAQNATPEFATNALVIQI